MKEVNLRIQNDMIELEQYGGHLSLWIYGASVKEKKVRLFLNMLRLCLKKQVLEMLTDILIEPIKFVKFTLMKNLKKKM